MERNSIQDAYVSKYSILRYTESYKHEHVQQILERDLIRLTNKVTFGLAANIDEESSHDIWQKTIDRVQFTIKGETS
jgi:hypothetical protein